ncbi:MAG: radical SAM protein [Desulforhabdus sp.]|nr:radical SAM protein [Desulforhabdus sp.]
MKITFVSLGLSTDAIGIRILSSLLRLRGHKTQLLFLPTLDDLRRRTTRARYSYSSRVLDQVLELCSDSDLIGISLMTHHFNISSDFTRTLQERLSAPIIWGGIHPTVCPEESLEFADMICLGEAESSLPELVDRMENNDDLTAIPGIWLRQNGRIVANGAGPLVDDLNELPFPDYSFNEHHLLEGEDLKPMTAGSWLQHLLRFFPPFNPGFPPRPAYQILSARGCPFVCTFCGETPLNDQIYGRRYFRKRNIVNVINELEVVKKEFDFIGEVCFCDDTFASRSFSEIEEFAQKYKERINLPFYILVSPANVTKKKFDLLVDAGLTTVGMGIQSGSDRIIKLYKRERVGHARQSLNAAKIINSYKGKLFPYYDFIVENPYESRDDLLETVRLLIRLPRPFRARVYALSFFPGTPLYTKASADGLLYDEMYDKTFGQRTKGGYLNFIIDLTKANVPGPVLKLMITKPILHLFNRASADPLFLGIHQMIKWIMMKLNIHQYGLT